MNNESEIIKLTSNHPEEIYPTILFNNNLLVKANNTYFANAYEISKRTVINSINKSKITGLSDIKQEITNYILEYQGTYV